MTKKERSVEALRRILERRHFFWLVEWFEKFNQRNRRIALTVEVAQELTQRDEAATELGFKRTSKGWRYRDYELYLPRGGR